jgi:acyl-CoA thioesterase-1
MVFLSLVVALPLQAAGAPRVLVLGDSLSAAYGIPQAQGWVTLLQARLQAEGFPHRVVNASITGDTTVGGRTRLPRALQQHDPAVVIIELGGNDGLRGLSLNNTRENLLAMVRSSQASGARVMLVGVKLPANYGSEFGKRFQRVFAEVSELTGAVLLPRLMAGVSEDRANMLADGIHPGAAAQPRLVENVWPLLEPLLGEDRGLDGTR